MASNNSQGEKNRTINVAAMKPIMETASFKQETSCNRQRNRHIPIGLVLQACRPSHMDVAVKGIQVLKTRRSRNVTITARSVSNHTKIRVNPSTVQICFGTALSLYAWDSCTKRMLPHSAMQRQAYVLK